MVIPSPKILQSSRIQDQMIEHESGWNAEHIQSTSVKDSRGGSKPMDTCDSELIVAWIVNLCKKKVLHSKPSCSGDRDKIKIT